MLRSDIMIHDDFTLTNSDKVTCLRAWGCLILILPMDWYGVCEIEFSNMGKNSGNPIWSARNTVLFKIM